MDHLGMDLASVKTIEEESWSSTDDSIEVVEVLCNTSERLLPTHRAPCRVGSDTTLRLGRIDSSAASLSRFVMATFLRDSSSSVVSVEKIDDLLARDLADVTSPTTPIQKSIVVLRSRYPSATSSGREMPGIWSCNSESVTTHLLLEVGQGYESSEKEKQGSFRQRFARVQGLRYQLQELTFDLRCWSREVFHSTMKKIRGALRQRKSRDESVLLHD